MTRDALLAKIMRVGLARNEALAYLTLLEDDGADGLTGYEVAARSGIPRSAVYAVLRKLEANGAAFGFGDGPVRFVATDPTKWVDHLRRDHGSTLDQLSTGLAGLPKRARPEPVWILRRYDEVIRRLEAMISSATHSVYLSLWPREVERLWEALATVHAKGLHGVLHSPAPLVRDPQGFACWVRQEGPDPGKASWSHKALAVVDRHQALIGGTEPEADNHAVWTSNPSLVDTATNHIILDITLMAQATGTDCAGDVGPMMRPEL